MAAPHPATRLATPILQTPDELLDDIFLRLPTTADLARASAACPSFHRLITDHSFLRRYRNLHPPPLIGLLEVDNNTFFPAQPPHPSAAAAHTFAGFDFSCSFLPSTATAGHTWSAIDLFDGRVLLGSTPEGEEPCDLDRELVVCDPVFLRYNLLPAVPGHLTAQVPELDLLDMDTFLAPGDEKDLLSFRVMCLVRCRKNMLLLVFSSLDGQWHALTFNQWGVPGPFNPYKDGLLNRQFVGRCFCWHPPLLNELLLLDTHSMEFSAVSLPPVSLPPEQLQCHNFVIVEAAEGMLGMLTGINDGHNDYGPYWLAYSILRNNQWHSEKIIPLPKMYAVVLFGVAGGYVLIQADDTTSSKKKFFSVDVKTLQVENKLQVELFGEGSYSGELYVGFRRQFCAPTIRNDADAM